MYKIIALTLLVSAYAIQSFAMQASEEHVDVLSVNHALNLTEILNKAVQRAPQQAILAAQQYDVQAKKELTSSYLAASPSISVLHQNDTIGSGRNERDWMVQLALPIWFPQEKLNVNSVATLSADHLVANTASLQLLVAGALREAVWDVVLNRNLAAMYVQQLETAMQLEAAVDKKYQAGELAKTDLMLVQQETIQAQKRLLDANAELMHAHFRYSQLTGLQEFPALFEEQQSSITSFEQSPQWQAALAKVRLAQGQRNLSRVQRRSHPQLMLNARSSQGAFDTNYNQSVGVQFQFPLDTAVSRAPRIAKAEQALGEAISAQARLKMVLEAVLHEAEHNLIVSRKTLALVHAEAVLAKRSADLALKAYQLGEIGLIRLLQTKNNALAAEKNHVMAQVEVKRNVARYNQAVGVLP